TVFFIAGLCSLGLPGFSGFVAEMTVFVGSWERVEMFYRVSTILACMSIVVTAVYILRASGMSLMGVIKNKKFESLTDATWNEKAAATLLIAGILIIGLSPFLLNDLITPGTKQIMQNVNRIFTLN
ncbi:MAG: NADH-quinone oxidoreductase subunit M, partial [Bacteroidia bacterium]|nr:NADH-quinone oxidoreductase subunit M [Bacteroidia bacterium]